MKLYRGEEVLEVERGSSDETVYRSMGFGDQELPKPEAARVEMARGDEVVEVGAGSRDEENMVSMGFERRGEVPAAEASTEEELSPDLDEMTVAELEEFAADHGIDLSDHRLKADKVEAVKAAIDEV